MKIIHSFWSKPALTNSNSSLGRSLGGWNAPKYHLFSWALSCLSIKRHYSFIELITDTYGKELLIDKIGLPYSKFQTSLDVLENYDNDLFAIGKLYSYSIQNEPFLHLDSDVYIWEKFDSDFETSQLVAQNEEINFQHDISTLKEINQLFSYIPQEIINNEKSLILYSSNAGVFGGTDFAFFKEYTKIAFEFINKNKNSFKKLSHPPLFNVIFEQYLFTCIAKDRRVPINYLLKNLDSNYIENLCSFDKVPKEKKYIHVIGPYKKQKTMELALEKRLLLEFPEYYYKIISLINENKI